MPALAALRAVQPERHRTSAGGQRRPRLEPDTDRLPKAILAMPSHCSSYPPPLCASHISRRE